MTDSAAPAPALGHALRRLYFLRFAFAIVWALAVFAVAAQPGPLLTVVLVVYPLADAAAVIWQLRSEERAATSRWPEIVNVVLSIGAAVALGLTAPSSVAGVLIVWGVWAILSGIAQLVAALLRRRTGGQIPLIVSGAISIPAGLSFLLGGLGGGASAAGVGGYAVLGGIFFLIAAIRLSAVLRSTE